MTSGGRPVSSVSSSIDALRRQFGLGRLSTYETITRQWPELVGEGPAGESVVVELRNGILRVEAYDPAVAEVITWSRQALVQAIRQACPTENVTDVSVRVRPRPKP